MNAGKSVEGACVLTARHPAERRHELCLGGSAERGNLLFHEKGKARKPKASVKVPMERAEAEQLVVAGKREIKAWSKGAALFCSRDGLTMQMGEIIAKTKPAVKVGTARAV